MWLAGKVPCHDYFDEFNHKKSMASPGGFPSDV
jgi:hypothetical protein